MTEQREASYRLMASSIWAVEIASPIGHCAGPDEDQNALFHDLSDCYIRASEDDFLSMCIVCDEKKVYGYLTFEDFGFSEPEPGLARARDLVYPIPNDMLISSSTPILELPSLFAKRDFFLLLSNNQITHTVRLQDTDKLPMQLALFALILELESALAECLVADEQVLTQCFGLLSPERRQEIDRVLKNKSEALQRVEERRVSRTIQPVLRRSRRSELEAKLHATSFIDKRKMIKGISVLGVRLHLLLESNRKIEDTFGKINEVRNQIAHGGSIWDVLGNASELNDLIVKMNTIIAALRDSKTDLERQRDEMQHTSVESDEIVSTDDLVEESSVEEEEQPKFAQPPNRPDLDELRPDSVPQPKKDDELVVTLSSGVDMTLVRIPAGTFVMGSNRTDLEVAEDGMTAFTDEMLQHILHNNRPRHVATLDEYYMGKYPVTVAQFTAFVEATGYKTTAEREGSGYIWDGSDWSDIEGADWKHPMGPLSDVQQKQDHPVQMISWEDSTAYCEWASQVAGIPICLPTEGQWEKAARGTDGRVYPWGDEGLWVEPSDAGDAAQSYRVSRGNMDEEETTPVGQYSPGGDSPYGCADMVGNVWEWCADWYDENYYSEFQPHNPAGPTSGQYRVLRGGSYYSKGARCAERRAATPNLRIATVGFRVCAYPKRS